MQITLFDKNPLVTGAIALAFEDLVTKQEVSLLTTESLTDLVNFDFVVTAGNSFGAMSDGLDLAIRDLLGYDIQDVIQEVIMKNWPYGMPLGEILLLSPLEHSLNGLIYAPTVRVPSEARTLDISYVMSVIVHYTLQHPDKTYAIPGLGTGCGNLTPEAGAAAMRAGYDTGMYIFSGSRCT